MTDRLLAPARSPLRRIPVKKSPINPMFPTASPGRAFRRKQLPVPSSDPEGDALRMQADVIDNGVGSEFEIGHLPLAFQRFWQAKFSRSLSFLSDMEVNEYPILPQKAKVGGLSPRSERLKQFVPQPRSRTNAVQAKLGAVREQVAPSMWNYSGIGPQRSIR